MRPKVLLVQPTIDQPGGGSAVTAWMIQALARSYDVSLLVNAPFDVTELNRLYDTALRATDLTLRLVPRWMCAASRLEPHPFGAQRIAWVIRAAKQIRHEYDVVISALNDLDLGGRSIQYIHHPVYHHVYERLEAMRQPPWPRALWTRARYRYRPWWLISGYSFERMKSNLTLVNSDWTGQWVRDVYDIPSTTLYPPVAGPRSNTPWEDREAGFVCVGRIVAEKNVLGIIEMLSAVRARCDAVRLHVVGVRGSRPEDDAYYAKVDEAVRRHASWVSMHENLSRTEVMQLIGSQRFGIHGMENEHYGMAVAEMVVQGCIVFVPNSGGQTEIVGAEAALCYDSATDAVDKICRVLGSASEQTRLRDRLRATPAILSPQQFGDRCLEIVDSFRKS